MPVLGTPTNKCGHGVFTAGESRGDKPWARYCSGCNPNLTAARATRRVRTVEQEEAEMDVTEFITRPMGERLAAALQG